ncbi:serine/threonine-protein kinase [Pseudoduganella sp. UC29_106]|uniref:serine/threonine-protein kinase n=1 Tax=Pseudoduganella sp. UC29_106 TaxID=3374553 RepID=UPI00375728B4
MSEPPDNDPAMTSPNTETDPLHDPSALLESGNNALPAGTHLGEFEIAGLIGEGGFGIVYRAYDHSLQRIVALKEYMPSALASHAKTTHVTVKSPRHASTFQAGLRSFVNEARLLAQFDHPSLVKVYRFWEANGTAYMVMPFYQGPTLKQYLRARATPPDEAWLKAFLAPLLDALDIIHHEQCFHRDIAPDNILILQDGRPLLLDFGAARRAIAGKANTFTVILKQGYAPVEQYAASRTIAQGPWTDIYALASVVYLAITGHQPVPSVARVVDDPHVPLEKKVAGKYSPEFLRAIDFALSVKPESRPQSIAELRSLLKLTSGNTNQGADTQNGQACAGKAPSQVLRGGRCHCSHRSNCCGRGRFPATQGQCPGACRRTRPRQRGLRSGPGAGRRVPGTQPQPRGDGIDRPGPGENRRGEAEVLHSLVEAWLCLRADGGDQPLRFLAHVPQCDRCQ